jgi:hypothetical protein
MAFFELRTPRDMLEKTKREYARLNASFDIDHVFNFFVSAYHISDYIKKSNAVPQAVIDAFLSDTDIQACHDLCDKGKHMRLTKPGRHDPQTVIWNGCFGGAPFGVLPFGGGDKWVVFVGNKQFDVEWLAQRVLEKWEAFFVQHGL